MSINWAEVKDGDSLWSYSFRYPEVPKESVVIRQTAKRVYVEAKEKGKSVPGAEGYPSSMYRTSQGEYFSKDQLNVHLTKEEAVEAAAAIYDYKARMAENDAKGYRGLAENIRNG